MVEILSKPFFLENKLQSRTNSITYIKKELWKPIKSQVYTHKYEYFGSFELGIINEVINKLMK